MKKKKYKRPPVGDIYRCLEIRKKSKRTGEISNEDLAYCTSLMKRFPAWYKALDAVVFNSTVPFGSRVKVEVDRYCLGEE